MRTEKTPCRRRYRRTRGVGCASAGFSLTEILVAVSLSALLFSAASLLFQAITVNSKRLSTVVSVNLGAVILQNFYGINENTINVYSAPNYGRGTAFAEELREIFWDDVGRASAVHCLARNALNTVRPAEIPYPVAPSWIRMDNAEVFREHLVSQFPEASTIFLSYQSVPSTASSGTIYVLGPSSQENAIDVVAVYEIDIVTTADPEGTYVSVRRYVDGAMTNYYDSYYPPASGTLFRPLFAAFERKTRQAVNEGVAIDKFKIAEEKPFYFIWWPDPAGITIEHETSVTYLATDPRQQYGHMGGRTSFMFTVPMFPSM
ncbi:MAG: type II secretion system protein J [Verrucomicrobiales bacterium]